LPVPPRELSLNASDIGVGTSLTHLRHNGRKWQVKLVLIAHKPTPNRSYCSNFFPIPRHGFTADHDATLEGSTRLQLKPQQSNPNAAEAKADTSPTQAAGATTD
jgi:hypothetical protein